MLWRGARRRRRADCRTLRAVLRALERCYLRLPSLGNNTAMIAKASLKVKISRERSVKVLRVCMCRVSASASASVCT